MLKKIFFILLIQPLMAISAMDTQEQYLIDHVKKSIANAKRGVSKLNHHVLALDGMSSSKVRYLLNNVCSLKDASYLEVGVWKGSTLISALFGNTHTLADATAIDNWAEFDGPRDIFRANVARFLPSNSVKFYDQDCFSVIPTKSFKNPINIYFYDGNHEAESQRLAFVHFNDAFSDVFIAMIDDWNYEPVRIGTRQAFEELHYTVLFEEILPANFNGDTQNWWDGFYIGVIRKNK